MKKIKITLLMISAVAIMIACKKSDPPLPGIKVGFEAAQQGLPAEINDININLVLSRPSEEAIPVGIEIVSTDLTYGEEFTTEPAATNNQVSVIIPAGSNTASLKLVKKTGIFLSGSEQVKFIIKNIPASALRGSPDTSAITFSAIISSGAQLILPGKTTTSPYANVVYVDLSSNQPTAVDRKSWNLGFYNGSEYRVIINPAYQSTIKAIQKTDIATVGFPDTVGVYLDHDISDPATATLVDDWEGDITRTAVNEISEVDAANNVYLLSFEANKNPDQYYKVKFSRSVNGYKIQYGRIGDVAVKTLDVPKLADFNFQFVSLETDKIVPVEPKAAEWDISWGYGTYNSGLGSPYWFQDLVLINGFGGVEAAEVLHSQYTYDAFTTSNVAALTFSAKKDAIGSKWRQGGGPSGPGSIKRDRFYVIRDPSGNIYKLRFVSWGGGGDAGERGRPVIEYELVSTK